MTERGPRKRGEIDEAVNGFLRTYCTALMQAYRWNLTKAAKRAGRDRVTFWRLLHRLGVKKP